MCTQTDRGVTCGRCVFFLLFSLRHIHLLFSWHTFTALGFAGCCCGSSGSGSIDIGLMRRVTGVEKERLGVHWEKGWDDIVYINKARGCANAWVYPVEWVWVVVCVFKCVYVCVFLMSWCVGVMRVCSNVWVWLCEYGLTTCCSTEGISSINSAPVMANNEWRSNWNVRRTAWGPDLTNSGGTLMVYLPGGNKGKGKG